MIVGSKRSLDTHLDSNTTGAVSPKPLGKLNCKSRSLFSVLCSLFYILCSPCSIVLSAQFRKTGVYPGITSRSLPRAYRSNEIRNANENSFPSGSLWKYAPALVLDVCIPCAVNTTHITVQSPVWRCPSLPKKEHMRSASRVEHSALLWALYHSDTNFGPSTTSREDTLKNETQLAFAVCAYFHSLCD